MSGRGVRTGADASRSAFRAVSTAAELDALAELLIDPERRQLVVGVTSLPDTGIPSVDIAELLAVLPPGSQVYFIPSGTLTYRLMRLLPNHRSPYNGALSAWIPGVDWDGEDDCLHLHVYDHRGEYGVLALKQLAHKLQHTLARAGLALDFDPVEACHQLELVHLHEQLQAQQRIAAEHLADLEHTCQDRIDGAQDRCAREIARFRATADRAAKRGERRCQEAVDRARSERDRALRASALAEQRLNAAECELELLRWRIHNPGRLGGNRSSQAEPAQAASR